MVAAASPSGPAEAEVFLVPPFGSHVRKSGQAYILDSKPIGKKYVVGVSQAQAKDYKKHIEKCLKELRNGTLKTEADAKNFCIMLRTPGGDESGEDI